MTAATPSTAKGTIVFDHASWGTKTKKEAHAFIDKNKETIKTISTEAAKLASTAGVPLSIGASKVSAAASPALIPLIDVLGTVLPLALPTLANVIIPKTMNASTNLSKKAADCLIDCTKINIKK